LEILAYALFGLAIILAIIVFGVNKWVVNNEVVIYAISLGISVIPEGLVAVVRILTFELIKKSNKRIIKIIY
jgi:magnesium-transporting ATPase (P-type)